MLMVCTRPILINDAIAIKDLTNISRKDIVMFIVFNYQRPVGSRIPLVEPLRKDIKKHVE